MDEKKVLNLGIDTDGVIFNLFLFQMEKGAIYFRKLNKDINIDGYNVDSILECKPKVRQEFWIKYFEEYNRLTGEKINIKKYDIKDIFNCSVLERQLFWIFNIYSYCMESELIEGSVETIQKWRSQGHKVYNITARKFVDKENLLGVRFRYLLKKRYEKEGIEFDDIDYCSEKESVRDKTIACSKRQVDFMMEDKTDNIEGIKRDLGEIKLICIDYPYNWDCSDIYQTRVTDFFEADKTIQLFRMKRQEMPEKKYVVNGKFKRLSSEKEALLSNKELIDYYKQLKDYYKNLHWDYENSKEYAEMIEYTQLKIYEKIQRLNIFDYHNNRNFESIMELFQYMENVRSAKAQAKDHEIELKKQFYRKWTYQYKSIEEHERNFTKYYNRIMPIFKLCFNPIIINKELIPYQKGLIFVSNHLSYWDQFPLLCATGNRPIHFLAASELLEKEKRGPLYENVGCEFVDRNSHKSKYNSFNMLAKILANNRDIGLYPEGTRNLTTRIDSYPDNILDLPNPRNEYRYLLEFHKGCLQLAQITGSPIIPTVTNGTDDKYTLKYNRDKLLIRIGQPILVTPKDDLNKKSEELTQVIRDMIWENAEYERSRSKKPCLYLGDKNPIIEKQNSNVFDDLEIQQPHPNLNFESLHLPNKQGIISQSIENSKLTSIEECDFQKKLKKVAR